MLESDRKMKATGIPRNMIRSCMGPSLPECTTLASNTHTYRCLWTTRHPPPLLRSPFPPAKIVQLSACSCVVKCVPVVGNQQEYRLYHVSIAPIQQEGILGELAHLLVRILFSLPREGVVEDAVDRRDHEGCIGTRLLIHHSRMSTYILVTWELCDPRILQNLRKASAMRATESTIMIDSTIMLVCVLMVTKQKYLV